MKSHDVDASVEQPDELFRSAVESMPLGTAFILSDGSIAYANPALCAMLGRDGTSLHGSAWAQLLDPASEASAQAVADLLGGSRATLRMRERLVRADGSTLWGDLSASTVCDAAGSPRYCVMQVADVTAEQSTNQVVQAELQDWARLTRMLDALLDPHVLLAAVRDEEYRVVNFTYADANDAACKLEGLSREDLLGTSLLGRHPGLGDDLLAAYAAVVDTGEPLVLNGLPYPGGSQDGELRRYDVRGSRCRDGIALTWRDVTDRDRAVAALADTEEQERLRLAATLDSMLDPHLLLEAVRDGADRIVDFVIADATLAACRQVGREADELVGTRLLTSRLTPGADELIGMYAGVIETGEPLELDGWHPTGGAASGEDRYFDIRAVPLGNDIALTWRDVTRRHTSAQALADSESHFRLLAENSSDVVARLDNDRLVRWISPSLAGMLGWSPADWLSTDVLGYVHPEDLTAARSACERAGQGESVVHRCRLRGPDQTFHWVEVHAKGYRDEPGDGGGLVLSFRTVETEVAYEAELRRVARYDGLTGLLTRKQMIERVTGLMHGQPRTGRQHAVLFCDLDKLEPAHAPASDEILKVVAGRISSAVRDSDMLGRASADEFITVLTGVHSLDDALEVAERVRYTVCDITCTSVGALTPSMSIGVCMISPGDDVDDLLGRADSALTEAKGRARNQVLVIPGPGGATEA